MAEYGTEERITVLQFFSTQKNRERFEITEESWSKSLANLFHNAGHMAHPIEYYELPPLGSNQGYLTLVRKTESQWQEIFMQSLKEQKMHELVDALRDFLTQ